jgi:hypothetical protein
MGVGVTSDARRSGRGGGSRCESGESGPRIEARVENNGNAAGIEIAARGESLRPGGRTGVRPIPAEHALMASTK